MSASDEAVVRRLYEEMNNGEALLMPSTECASSRVVQVDPANKTGIRDLRHRGRFK
jgi:hypothetical protein